MRGSIFGGDSVIYRGMDGPEAQANQEGSGGEEKGQGRQAS
jgi:hypothetical protein